MRASYVLSLSFPFIFGCGAGSAPVDVPANPVSTAAVPAGNYRVLGANDLGMHCIDRDFSTFSILPPFNVVRAQVLYRTPGGTPRLLQPSEVTVTYEPVADAHGSINSYSKPDKTNFWKYVGWLFGANLPEGKGLTGLYMPNDAPQPGPQAIAWNAGEQVFQAFGIPITATDDAGNTNPYPLMRLRARNPGTGATLATVDVVVPVSGETDCSNCHATGGIAASQAGPDWSTNADLDTQARENVLVLHDVRHQTKLHFYRPVLCASCHDSPPLDLGGPPPPSPIPQMSRVMHSFHGRLHDSQGNPVFPPNGTPQQTCYQCHPGAVTECLRGVMKTAGMDCYSCHGDMLAVGGQFRQAPGGSLDGMHDLQPRRPWQDLPRCQSCHTGNAVTHLSGGSVLMAPDGIRLRQAWRVNDPAASAIAAPTSPFAENPNKLYRYSKGHGGVTCEGCHGSTHAEWPVADPAANDNVAANQLQGHTGTIIECATCHASGTLPVTMNGPHGMHNVDSQSFVNDHHDLYEQNPAACRACHGSNLLGTPLSKAAANRSFTHDGHTYTIAKGSQVRCNQCHGLPGSDN